MGDTITAIDQATQQPITGVLATITSNRTFRTVFVDLLVNGEFHHCRITRDDLDASGARPRPGPTSFVYASEAFLWKVIDRDYNGYAEHCLAELERREVAAAEAIALQARIRRYESRISAAALMDSVAEAR